MEVWITSVAPFVSDALTTIPSEAYDALSEFANRFDTVVWEVAASIARARATNERANRQSIEDDEISKQAWPHVESLLKVRQSADFLHE